MPRIAKPTIQQELYNLRQAREYLGGNLGLDRISDLMENGTIPGIYLGGKLIKCTTKKHLDNFINRMFNEIIQNDIIESAPINLVNNY